MSTVTEEKKSIRMVGPKVSQIANIFQRPTVSKDPDIIVVKQNASPTLDNKLPVKVETPNQVTVVRTESHLARFNNARALFEKLGTGMFYFMKVLFFQNKNQMYMITHYYIILRIRYTYLIVYSFLLCTRL